jgi:hypothetical protein
MTAVTRMELRAEIPFVKWHDGLDSFFILAVLFSLFGHLGAGQLAKLLPPPAAKPAAFAMATFVPDIVLPLDLPLPTPEPIAIRPGPAQPGTQAISRPGPAGKTGGVLDALNDNPQLLELITRESETPGWAQALSKLSATPTAPRGPLNVATAGDRLPTGEPAQALAINLGDLGNTPKAPVDLGKRTKRKIVSDMRTPTTTTSDAEANGLVRAALRAKLGGVRHCYEQALKLQPSLAGKVTAQVTFAAGGRVTAVSIVANTLGEASVAACVTRRLQGAKTGGPLLGAVTATVPYIFSAAN